MAGYDDPADAHGSNFNNSAFDVDAGLRCFEIVDPAVRLGLPDVPRHTYRASAHLGLDGGAAVGLNLVVNDALLNRSMSQEFLFVQIFSSLPRGQLRHPNPHTLGVMVRFVGRTSGLGRRS